jgi:hypothetical protein
MYREREREREEGFETGTEEDGRDRDKTKGEACGKISKKTIGTRLGPPPGDFVSLAMKKKKKKKSDRLKK